ncbi:acyltransferase [Halomonas sp. M4R5S39]|uniref:acyltransferase n=1 Tax=Halomonas kalidii TaxID=3043293 RepID=UPI0024A7D64D|nr:acyltransferase [Halomonas kalidii]MDI5985630.1 acyltransferase [Halomonas kalidii]
MLRRAKRAVLASLHRVLKVVRRSPEKADLPAFNACGVGVSFESPRKVLNPQCMSVGDHVKIGPYCQIAAITEYPGPWLRLPDEKVELQRFEPIIHIGDRVTATSSLHIYSQHSVLIEDGVGFGPNVFINDASHGHECVDVPFMWQPLQDIAAVSIGRGCWIAANVVIMPGVHIGEQSIIGANSVVAESIPPYCIAAGAPAKVIKRWNVEAQRWEKVAHSSDQADQGPAPSPSA